MRIVIVEDEIITREGIAKLLDKLFPEHEVVGSAENGQEGLELILKVKPDLVITDIKMPVMDGLEMLEKIYENKLSCKVIVLSAYAEFSYAQKAIRWGVSEYLLKPLVVGDFAQAIRNIERQIVESDTISPDVLGRLDHIIFGIIFSSMEPDEKLKLFLKSQYGITENTQFSEVLIYLGKDYSHAVDMVKADLEKLLKERKDLKYCILEITKENNLLAVLYGYEDRHAAERWFQNIIVSQKCKNLLQDCSYGWINASGIAELKSSYQKILQYMDWNISFGSSIMISYPKILQVQTSICIYPIEIENEMKSALCSLKTGNVYKSIQKFNTYFGTDKIYTPKEIKECYIRFLWAMINVAEEIGIINQDRIDQKNILERIMGAIKKKELEDVANETFACINDESRNEDNNLSLNVKRARNMIHEYYHTGITLEEIANKLNITPEYLGAQFHKEMGVTFSSYIKEYRIKKAKMLLIGSNLKVSEVAEKLGYYDAKYFSRVFKESTGQLPVEYRKLNK